MSDTNDSQKIIDCPHCGKAISATSEKCPYCQQEINQQPEQSQEDNKTQKLNIKKILFIAYAVLSVFVILGLYNSLSSAKMRNENLQKKIEAYQYDIDDYKDTIKDLKKQLAEKEDYESKYNELNSQLDNYKDQQATINDQNNKLTEIQSQYDSLQSERDNLQQQVDAKKAAEEQAARAAQQQQLEQESQNTEETVYFEKYTGDMNISLENNDYSKINSLYFTFAGHPNSKDIIKDITAKVGEPVHKDNYNDQRYDKAYILWKLDKKHYLSYVYTFKDETAELRCGYFDLKKQEELKKCEVNLKKDKTLKKEYDKINARVKFTDFGSTPSTCEI